MKNILISLVFLVSFPALILGQNIVQETSQEGKKSEVSPSAYVSQAARAEVFFAAMQDEINRTVKQLKQNNLSAPYYAAYKVFDLRGYFYTSVFGSSSREEEAESIAVQTMLRVGSAQEDNSFFESGIYSTAFNRQSPSAGYYGLRGALWTASDAAYKEALAVLAKKQAYKKNKNITEAYADFSKAQITSDVQEISLPVIDGKYFKRLAEEMSAQGLDLTLDRFEAAISVSLAPVYFLSSEGAKYSADNSFVVIGLKAWGKTSEGFDLQTDKHLTYASLADLPSREELVKIAKDFALQSEKETKGRRAEPYIGPVMLEEEAAAELFDNALYQKIGRTKEVLSGEGSFGNNMGELASKKGLKIMPVDFDVVDDPSLIYFKGKKLSGAYNVDDEGVKSVKLQLVKNGKLTDLPSTRSLSKELKKTNGHARIPVYENALYPKAWASNLMILPHKTTPKREFKAKFMQYCAEEGLDYCYIIRTSPSKNIFSAYKVNAKTGEETPVYGISRLDLNARSLRDIKFASDDLTAYNFSSFSFAPYSIIAPSVILTEAEIKPTREAPARKPLIPRP